VSLTQNCIAFRDTGEHEKLGSSVVASAHAVSRFMQRVARDKEFREHEDIAKKYIELTVAKSLMTTIASMGNGESLINKTLRVHADGVTFIVLYSDNSIANRGFFVVKTCYRKRNKVKSGKQKIKGRLPAKRVAAASDEWC